MLLVVTLTVLSEAAERFRAYERSAAVVMEKHGGRIERTVLVGAGPGAPLFKEVHLVRFPGPEAFESFKRDPELLALANLRAEAIVGTDVMIGEDGPSYHRGRG